jgi:hypothetical protein
MTNRGGENSAKNFSIGASRPGSKGSFENIHTAANESEVVCAVNNINKRTKGENKRKRFLKSPRGTPTLPKLNLPPMPPDEE